MAENKKSFILYADLINSIDHLTNEEKGILFTHLLDYVNDKNPILTDRLILTAWKPIEEQLKRDLRKFKEVKVKRSEAGKKSAELRQQNSTNPTSVESAEQTSTNPTDNVNVNENENVNDNDILLEKETKEIPQENLIEDELVNPEIETSKKVAPKKVSFQPPDPKDVQNYCEERQNGISGQYFCDFYASKGWKVGNQKMIDWKASVRTWEQKNKTNGTTNNTKSGFNTGKISGHQFAANKLREHFAGNSKSGDYSIDVEAVEQR